MASAYAEAADLGIDNLEHGFLAATDFVADKKPDACPGQGAGQRTIAELDETSAAFQAHARAAKNQQSSYIKLFPKGMALERAFVKAGGLLVAGTDPTGAGGVIPGFANQRQIELLVEAGFTPVEAISIGTLNGAKYLGRDARVGSLSVGKQADLVVINGDPSTNIADIRKVETVFRQGVGYDPQKLIQSVSGFVGLW